TRASHGLELRALLPRTNEVQFCPPYNEISGGTQRAISVYIRAGKGTMQKEMMLSGSVSRMMAAQEKK
ncbi:hypothetical protein DBR06_SOUSAS1510005, partial [Sousa chinensis]